MYILLNLIILFQDEMAVCYAEFCDVFRCRNYLRLRRKKNKNVRNSFTKIMGSQEAFYDLGINVYHDTDEDIMEQFRYEKNPALKIYTCLL